MGSFGVTSSDFEQLEGQEQIELDCEQSLFSSKIRGKERKTSKRASLTVRLMWERR